MAILPRIQPTTEQLRAAFDRRRRRHWPTEYDTAMADPLLHALVHMEAVLAVLQTQRQQRRQHLAAQQRTRAAHHHQPRAAAGADRKRLAAGDPDDDHDHDA